MVIHYTHGVGNTPALAFKSTAWVVAGQALYQILSIYRLNDMAGLLAHIQLQCSAFP